MSDIQEALDTLEAGGLIVFPTETVWALACRGHDKAAADHIRVVKRRPPTLPMAVGFASWAQARRYVDPTPGADALAERFLPGPLSIIARRADPAMAHVAPGQQDLSVRVPDHPIAAALLAAGPLVMTSANRHGQPDPITAEDVRKALAGDRITFVGDESVPGTASTIVDATGATPKILREGIISETEVAAAWP